MSDLFDARFRAMLGDLLRRVRRVGGRRESELRARRRAGARGGTFAGHRGYADGDDLRTVDWNAFARSGELHVKTFEEDDRRLLTLLLDCTPSMLAGAEPRHDGARRVAAILGGLALARLDGVRLVSGADRANAFRGAAALPDLLAALAALTTGPQEPRALAEIVVERGFAGSLCWVSDFAIPEEFAPALRVLRGSGRRCTGVLPALADDRLPDVGGWVLVRDPESGRARRVRVDPPLRAALEHELLLLARQQDAVFRAAGCELVRFPLPAPGDHRLASWGPGPWIHRI